MGDSHPKLTRGLVERLSAAPGADQIPIIVGYVPQRRLLRHRGVVRGVREVYRFRLKPFVHMYATPEAIARLETDPEVVRVYEDLPVHAYLEQSVPHIGVPRLWDEQLTGESVRIAVVDTGIDASHPDFQGRIGNTVDLTGEGPDDGNGHGSHCASTAAGSGAASEGRYRGVAPGATIYAAKVLTSDGNGMMSDVMAGIEWSVDQGVQIISLSLGGPGPCDGTDALCQMCDAAVDAGLVLCVAGGNDGPSPGTIGTPGGAHRVITVGAADNTDQMAGFSSRGPCGDGRAKPDVVLPGVDIVAARARGTALGLPVGPHYTSASGTSMATPHAAGVCALLLQRQPSLRPEESKARLMSTAVDIGQSPHTQGSGRVDAWRAAHPEAPPEPPPPPPRPPGTGPRPGQGCATALLGLLFRRRGER